MDVVSPFKKKKKKNFVKKKKYNTERALNTCKQNSLQTSKKLGKQKQTENIPMTGIKKYKIERNR